MSQHHQLIKNDPRWKAARQEAFDRDGRECVDCGSTEDLQADHDPVPLWRCLADPELEPLAYDVDNLRTRCGPCNRKRGGNDGQELVRQLWISPKYPELLGVVAAGS